MVIDEGKKSGTEGDDAYDEEESPSSRLGGDVATDDADKTDSSNEVRKAAIGEREPFA